MAKASWPPQGVPQQFAVGLLIGVLGASVLVLGYLAVARTGTRPPPVAAPLAVVAAAPTVAAPPPVAPVASQVVLAPEPATPPAPVVAAPPPPSTPPPFSKPATPPPPPPAHLIPAEVELVDCTRAGAPAWCRQVRAATKSERAGTLVAVVRSSVPGDVFACSGGLYIGEVTPESYASASLAKKLGAHAIDRIPRGSALQYSYAIRPQGSGLPEPEYLRSCF